MVDLLIRKETNRAAGLAAVPKKLAQQERPAHTVRVVKGC